MCIRDRSLFCLPSSEDTNKKRSRARAFKNAVPKLWNPLDYALKRGETPAVFKKKLKTFTLLKKAASLLSQTCLQHMRKQRQSSATVTSKTGSLKTKDMLHIGIPSEPWIGKGKEQSTAYAQDTAASEHT